MCCCSRPRRRVFHLVTGGTLVFALAGPAAISVAGASSVAPRKAPAPSITVTPSKGLRRNQKVEVTGKNFPHKTQLVIVECNPGVLKDESTACATSRLVFVKTGAKGTFPKTSFQVIAGTVGKGSCGTTTKNLTCYIFVSEPTVTSTVDADAVIRFAKPKS